MDPNSKDQERLFKEQKLAEAVVSGNLSTVKDLVLNQRTSARSKDANDTPVLVLAVQSGNLAIVEFLIDQRAYVNWVSPAGDATLYSIATEMGFTKIADYLQPLIDSDLQEIVDNRARQNATGADNTLDATQIMFESIEENDLEAVQRLLQDGFDVNSRFEEDVTSLIFAAGLGNLEIVRLLVQAGADVNALDSDFESALLRAKINGFSQVADYLEPLTSDEIRAVVDEQVAD